MTAIHMISIQPTEELKTLVTQVAESMFEGDQEFGQRYGTELIKGDVFLFTENTLYESHITREEFTHAKLKDFIRGKQQSIIGDHLPSRPDLVARIHSPESYTVQIEYTNYDLISWHDLETLVTPFDFRDHLKKDTKWISRFLSEVVDGIFEESTSRFTEFLNSRKVFKSWEMYTYQVDEDHEVVFGAIYLYEYVVGYFHQHLNRDIEIFLHPYNMSYLRTALSSLFESYIEERTRAKWGQKRYQNLLDVNAIQGILPLQELKELCEKEKEGLKNA